MKQRIIERATLLSAQAARLGTTVTDVRLAQEVRGAVHDIHEGLRWLEMQDVEARPHLLEAADAALWLAENRLAQVQEAVDTATTATPPTP